MKKSGRVRRYAAAAVVSFALAGALAGCDAVSPYGYDSGIGTDVGVYAQDYVPPDYWYGADGWTGIVAGGGWHHGWHGHFADGRGGFHGYGGGHFGGHGGHAGR